jgi:predicted transcriptional regulator of viral defense system
MRSTKVFKFSSLFDYLKRPAGKELGLRVKQLADEIGVEVRTREISNPKFTGKVALYPTLFLIYYFSKIDPASNLQPQNMLVDAIKTMKQYPTNKLGGFYVSNGELPF